MCGGAGAARTEAQPFKVVNSSEYKVSVRDYIPHGPGLGGHRKQSGASLRSTATEITVILLGLLTDLISVEGRDS